MGKTYIYGAGELATQIFKMCTEAQIKVDGFIDPKKVGANCNGFEVQAIRDLPSGSRVLIGVLNNFVHIADVVKDLLDAGVSEVLTPPQVFFLFGENGQTVEWYWLSTDKQYVKKLADKSRQLLEPILDEKSLVTLHHLLEYRCGNNNNEDSELRVEDQYFESGIPGFWDGPVYLLDGGAYIGDTIIEATRRKINLSSVYAFEPDPQNFQKLRENVENLKVSTVAFQAALHDENSLAYFNFTSGTGSSMSDQDSVPNTQLLQFDSSIIGLPVSHIKLDIEGGEAKALQGMSRAIKLNNPRMAISVYHKPDDLFTLPNLIMGLGNYSRFTLRNYAHQSFETIFYASP
jgi:FkbM family methyltransferase